MSHVCVRGLCHMIGKEGTWAMSHYGHQGVTSWHLYHRIWHEYLVHELGKDLCHLMGTTWQ